MFRENERVIEPDDVLLLTSDGVRLAARHWDAGAREVGCVVGHGFTGSSRNAHVQRICRGLAGRGIGVLAPDFRGHGRSGGLGTAGRDEIHDVAAAVAWLRAAGYRWVAVVGWSMGGTAVLRYAGLGGDADAVVSVSAPGSWFERGTRPMRLVHWMFETRTGRAATRMLRRTRISAAGWPTLPEAPAEVAGAIAPRPLLIVHGESDHYFPMHHVEALAAAAPHADVWIESGMGHAEVATTARLIDRLAVWLLAARDRVPTVWDDDLRD
jgi:pimeloyl-ACP methyl ester carboxylesterase